MTKLLDDRFAALADPTRRAVIEHLAGGPASVGTLHAAHDMALPSFVRHIRVLEQAGLVVTHKTGRVRHVALAPEAFQAPEDWICRQRRHWSHRLDAMAALAEQIERTRS